MLLFSSTCSSLRSRAQFWAILLLFIGAHEAWRIRTGWTTEGGSVLKADREPGDLGFDPLKLFPRDNPEAAYDLQSKELNNGRLVSAARHAPPPCLLALLVCPGKKGHSPRHPPNHAAGDDRSRRLRRPGVR